MFQVKSKTEDGLDIKTVSVIRTVRGRIGLTLGVDKDGQIYAEDVVPDEPAAKDGGLKRGDIIMEVSQEYRTNISKHISLLKGTCKNKKTVRRLV